MGVMSPPRRKKKRYRLEEINRQTCPDVLKGPQVRPLMASSPSDSESTAASMFLQPPDDKAIYTKSSHLLLPITLSNGDYVPALVDTGSTINLLSKELLPHLWHQALPAKKITIHGLTGCTVTDSWYLVAIPLATGKPVLIIAATGDFYDTPILLGMPFLTQMEALIDAPNKKIVTKQGILNAWGPEELAEAEDAFTATVYRVNVSATYRLLTTDEVSQHPDVVHSLSDTLLSMKGQQQTIHILTKYQKVWTRKGVGAAKGVSHTIVTKHNRPIALRPRHFPIHQQAELDRQTQEMLEDGVIVPSSSPYVTYPVLVTKKDGGWRMAIDYRALNDITVPDKMPLPNIEDLLHLIEGSSLFALVDLRAGFWQIAMDPTSTHKTAFSTHSGHFEFLVMPFGLINAPATFQRWTSDMFAEFHYKGMLVYLDDLLIHAQDETIFLTRLAAAFNILETYGAQVKLSKCKFAPIVTLYLGHIIQQGIRRPDPTKLEPLHNIRSPKTTAEVRSILGKLGYYRQYIPNYAERTIPLTRLLRKGAKMKWTEDLNQIVKEAARDMTKAMLRVGIKGQRFRLEVDASQRALGAVLYDEEEFQRTGRSTLPILCLSKTLNETEERWSTPEKEAYSIVWALEQADHFVRGREVLLYTDHLNLSWMQNFKSGKIARWCARLSEYYVTIIYQSGAKNDVADFLSRMIQPDPLEKDTMSCYLITVNAGKRERSMMIKIEPTTPKPSTLITAKHPFQPPAAAETPPQVSQEELTPIIFLPEEDEEGPPMQPLPRQHPLLPPVSHPTIEAILKAQQQEAPKHLVRGFRYQGEYLFYLTGLWVPPSLRHQLLDYTHLAMPHWHPGTRRMTQLLRRAFCWEHMIKDIQSYLKGCVTCQRTKPQPPQLPLKEKHHPTAAPFQHVYLDLWGPADWEEGEGEPQRWILTMVDNVTKWAEAEVIEDKRATTLAATFFKAWISRFGAPWKLTTDNETALKSELFRHLLQTFGIHHHYTIPYHPQGAAIVESFHRTLKRTLQRINLLAPGHFTFSEALSWALLAYRSFPHSTVYESPAYLAFGADPIYNHASTPFYPTRPTEKTRLRILGEVRQEIQRKQQLMIQYAQEKLEKETPIRRLFQIGDWVLKEFPQFVRDHQAAKSPGTKLEPRWSRPHRVTSRSTDGYAAQVLCPLTGKLSTVYLDKVRFIDFPTTAGQQEVWRRSLEQTEGWEPESKPTEVVLERSGERKRARQ